MEPSVSLYLLVSACFLLAAASQPKWVFAEGRQALRRPVAGLGWLLLGGAAAGFVSRFGWEVGLAWFLLWTGLSTVAVTLWLSWRPLTAPWLAGLCAGAGLVLWVL